MKIKANKFQKTIKHGHILPKEYKWLNVPESLCAYLSKNPRNRTLMAQIPYQKFIFCRRRKGGEGGEGKRGREEWEEEKEEITMTMSDMRGKFEHVVKAKKQTNRKNPQNLLTPS